MRPQDEHSPVGRAPDSRHAERCRDCGEVWPCTVAQLRARVAELEAENARLREELGLVEVGRDRLHAENKAMSESQLRYGTSLHVMTREARAERDAAVEKLAASASVSQRMRRWAEGDEGPTLTLLAKWVLDLDAALAGEPMRGIYGSSPDPLIRHADPEAVAAVLPAQDTTTDDAKDNR